MIETKQKSGAKSKRSLASKMTGIRDSYYLVHAYDEAPLQHWFLVAWALGHLSFLLCSKEELL